MSNGCLSDWCIAVHGNITKHDASQVSKVLQFNFSSSKSDFYQIFGSVGELLRLQKLSNVLMARVPWMRL